MPLPLNGTDKPSPDGEALLRDAAARGRKLVDELTRHRRDLADDPAGAFAEGAAALDRAIEAAGRLVRDLTAATSDGTLPTAHQRQNDERDET